MIIYYIGMAAILVMWSEQFFVPQFLWKLHVKFGFNRPSGFSGKEVSKCWNWVTLVQGQWMTLTFDIHTGSCTHLACSVYGNLTCFVHTVNNLCTSAFFPYKSIRDQIWPCRKIGQGQPRVIIWTNLVVLEHPMLHTKFLGHRPFGLEKKVF